LTSISTGVALGLRGPVGRLAKALAGALIPISYPFTMFRVMLP
jgi:exosortase/archaeosortase